MRRRTSQLPVIFVFGRKKLDVALCAERLTTYIHDHSAELQAVDHVVLKYDVGYAHLADDLAERLLPVCAPKQFIHVPLSLRTSPVSRPEAAAEQAADPPFTSTSHQTLTLWVGEESPTLTKLLMTSSGEPVSVFPPQQQYI